MTDEEFEAVKRACFDWWGLDNPDVIEAFHAYRILQISNCNPLPMLFDDFVVAWSAKKNV